MKYKKRFFLPPAESFDWVKKEGVTEPPIWCSVDLRDGNQALVIPMSLEEKIEFFDMLVKIGFKEIEIGFPAASETEFSFCRTLIDKNLIPDDVTVQVLTQARDHIIRRTFEAIDGMKNVIVHLYNSTSVAQREQVFRKSREEITAIAVDGAKLALEEKQKFEKPGVNIRFEYSPESFTGTEPEFALEVCNAVIDVINPTPDNKLIINLPVTVEESMPHIYACQVEYMSKNLKNREAVTVSLHPHNDRGTGVADSELGLLAGAERIEGTLFGNGERTGNVDIVTLAMNMYSQGVTTGLDFSNLPELAEKYCRLTRMNINERQPYSGALVFAAFSGSHQDAIAKGMKYREENPDSFWNVPYLSVDPHDIGREYDADVIRINSQSGRGGVGYILSTNFGYNIPTEMRDTVGKLMKDWSDKGHRELRADEVLRIFNNTFVNKKTYFDITEVHYVQMDGKKAKVKLKKSDNFDLIDGKLAEIVVSAGMNTPRGKTIIMREAVGNGRLDAVSQAVKDALKIDYTLTAYTEHALTKGSSSLAAAYVCIERGGVQYWGVGVLPDIIDASVAALVSAVNNSLSE
ncbi:MAG: 2-isopropylmalate synthase [Ruminococcus sp.]|jgi:2-isopropylmalate synthase|nr:2-isopropylmalate synthase [Ruminococcus sp.]